MAAGEAANGEPRAFDDTEPNKSYVGILRTGWKVEALGGAEGVESRREYGLVEPVDGSNGSGWLNIRRLKRHGATWEPG